MDQINTQPVPTTQITPPAKSGLLRWILVAGIVVVLISVIAVYILIRKAATNTLIPVSTNTVTPSTIGFLTKKQPSRVHEINIDGKSYVVADGFDDLHIPLLENWQYSVESENDNIKPPNDPLQKSGLYIAQLKLLKQGSNLPLSIKLRLAAYSGGGLATACRKNNERDFKIISDDLLRILNGSDWSYTHMFWTSKIRGNQFESIIQSENTGTVVGDDICFNASNVNTTTGIKRDYDSTPFNASISYSFPSSASKEELEDVDNIVRNSLTKFNNILQDTIEFLPKNTEVKTSDTESNFYKNCQTKKFVIPSTWSIEFFGTPGTCPQFLPHFTLKDSPVVDPNQTFYVFMGIGDFKATPSSLGVTEEKTIGNKKGILTTINDHNLDEGHDEIHKIFRYKLDDKYVYVNYLVGRQSKLFNIPGYEEAVESIISQL